MIDLAISIEDDAHGITVVETNHGDRLAAPKWPQDSDFRLVVFSPDGKDCEVLPPRELAHDIALALEAAKRSLKPGSRKPEWYRRLSKCAAGVT
jgi:hypothetical protein